MTTSPLARAFDATAFRDAGHRLVDQLADYLEAAQAGAPMAVLPRAIREERVTDWPAEFSVEGGADLGEIIGRVIAQSNHLHHRRYVGHQVSAPLPTAALAELVSGLLNNGMAVFEMGPAAVAMERNLVSWMAERLGMALGEGGAGGVLTSGGSVGNLTALLAARQARAGFDLWDEGQGSARFAVLASAQAHYCVDRAVRIMGMGKEGVVTVPVDEKFRVRPDALPAALAEAERRGRKVIAVVASAGSTATGAYDPLRPIADFCARHDLWLHVDGAHGASAAMSAKHRALVEGIERADSVVWDAHKMMLMPALVTAVLFRDGRRSYEAFAQEASYLFTGGHRAQASKSQVPQPDEQWENVGLRTLECTKRMMSLGLYASLAVHGTGIFSEHIDNSFALAQSFAALLGAAPDFEIPVEPQGNIVCFRYLAPGLEGARLDDLQAAIRRSLVESGAFYLVQTRLPNGVHLRTALMNPLTKIEDLAALLEAIRATARELLP